VVEEQLGLLNKGMLYHFNYEKEDSHFITVLLQFPFNKSPQISTAEICENAKQFL
jgi:hypothetical protein